MTRTTMQETAGQTTRRLVLLVAVGGLLAGIGQAREFDTVVETTHRKVTWDDFKGREFQGNRWDDGSWAHLTSAMVVEPARIVPRELPDGTWVAVQSQVEAYAVMDKDLSGAAPGASSPELLAHEQLHFDITEAFARRLVPRLDPIEGTGRDARSAVEDLQRKLQEAYDQANKELLAYQNSYDAETRHGTRRKVQKKWSEKAATLFAEATAELERFRAASDSP